MKQFKIAAFSSFVLVTWGGFVAAESLQAEDKAVTSRMSFARIDVFPQSFDKGGWALDCQFMDVMGSPYLLAHGLGRPVWDAEDRRRLGWILGGRRLPDGARGGFGVRRGVRPREVFARGLVREIQRKMGGDWPGNPDPAHATWRIMDDESKGVTFGKGWRLCWNCNGEQVGHVSHG